MARKSFSAYVCYKCGYQQTGYLGRCPECGQWNTLEKRLITVGSDGTVDRTTIDRTKKPSYPVPLDKVEIQATKRLATGLKELDNVLGGGAMPSSVVLIGGEPGIGKSTLLLQVSSYLALKHSVLYVSGEESPAQIKARATRLSVNTHNIRLLCTTSLEDVLLALGDSKGPSAACIILDSIQTIFSQEAGSIPGTINQLKYCAAKLIEFIKEGSSVLFITAHITKEGSIAGPMALEHMVDTVISFEHTNDCVRFLRAKKNRFGSIDELGIFSMEDRGLVCVASPSTMFITQRKGTLPQGIGCTAIFEGTRVFLVEIQALVVDAKASLSRVYSDKVDSARVNRVAAVLEKHLGICLSDKDIYINVAGGMKPKDSAIDLCLAAILYSALSDLPLPQSTLLIGELSLAGEIRPIPRLKQRIKTAKELGFKHILTPIKEDDSIAIPNVKDMVKCLFNKRLCNRISGSLESKLE